MAVTRIMMEGGHKVCLPIPSREEYLKLRGSSEQKRKFAAVRGGDDSMKEQLLQFNYTLLPPQQKCPLRGYHLVGNSFCHDIDCYDPAQSAEIAKNVIDKKDELRLLMLERTAHYGLHIVCERQPGTTVLENQVRTATILHAEMDTNTKDLQRVWFASTDDPDELLFLDDRLFQCNMTEADGEAEYQLLRQRSAHHLDNVPDEARKSNKHYCPGSGQREEDPLLTSPRGGTESQSATDDAPHSGGDGEGVAKGVTYQGIPFSDIIRKYWELYHDGQEPSEGNRNVLTYELAMTLRSICDYSQQRLEAVIPRYDNFDEEEWRRTIESALKEPRKGMPYRLRQVLSAVRSDRKLLLLSGNNSTTTDLFAQLPERPKKMPAFLTLISSKVPTKLKAMVEEAIWPALCAHLHGVTFRYIDGVVHEANICSPLIGRQSTGKGHVNQPIEYLLADITARDEESKKREADWRRRNQGRAASKDRQPRPDDIVIQRLDDDLTPAALAQSLIDAEHNGAKRIITKVDEIELLNKVGNGRNDTVGLLVRYGFDTARWGQRRVGLDSVNGSYTVRWVWNASCTLRSARKFITSEWLANGSLSRLNVNALLLPDDDHEMPLIATYDDAYAEQIKPYIDRLNAANGLIECPQAAQLAKQLVDEHSQMADLCESEGYRILSYRAVVIGWLKALILYIANGYKWDTTIEQYVRYSVRRDMWLKMYFFGEQIETEFEEEERQTHSGPQNLLEFLPAEFTYDEFLQIRQQHGRKGDGKGTLKVWKSRGYVDFDEVTNTWRQFRKSK